VHVKYLPHIGGGVANLKYGLLSFVTSTKLENLFSLS